MKKILLIAFLGTLFATGSAFAHCGSCGTDAKAHDHKHAAKECCKEGEGCCKAKSECKKACEKPSEEKKEKAEETAAAAPAACCPAKGAKAA